MACRVAAVLLVLVACATRPAEPVAVPAATPARISDREAAAPRESEPGRAAPVGRFLILNPGVDTAAVHVDGKLHCQSPCELKLPVGDGNHEIRFRKDGYRDVVLVWQPQSVDDTLPELPQMEKL